MPSSLTSDATVKKTKRFMNSAGLAPLVLKKELKGFVFNRYRVRSFGKRTDWFAMVCAPWRDIDTLCGMDWVYVGLLSDRLKRLI